jgi:hypothetical protein
MQECRYDDVWRQPTKIKKFCERLLLALQTARGTAGFYTKIK